MVVVVLGAEAAIGFFFMVVVVVLAVCTGAGDSAVGIAGTDSLGPGSGADGGIETGPRLVCRGPAALSAPADACCAPASELAEPPRLPPR